MFKRLLIIIGLVLFGAIGTGIYVVKEARDYTNSVVLPDQRSGQWRIYTQQPEVMNTALVSLKPHWKNWLIKIQDPNFYGHSGIDLTTPGAGLTTISQSIVKKLYFADFKPGYRKLTQSLIAMFAVDKLLTKDEQLAFFLNVSYMGNKDGGAIYGFENAAQQYYARSLSELDDEQFLSLLAMLIGAKQFNVSQQLERNQARVDRIKRVLSGDYVPAGLNDVYYDKEPTK